MKRKLALSLGITAILFGLTACGGEEAGSNDTEATNVLVEASNWKFDKEEYTSPAGKVNFELKNSEGYHGITIDDTDVKIEGDGEATATLDAGEYTVRCSVPCGEGHEEMTAKLVVE